MTDITLEQDPFIVITEPEGAEWADIACCTIDRTEGATRVSLTCLLKDGGYRLLLFQTGPRRHFTYRILQKPSTGGPDVITTVEVPPIHVSTGKATFQDRIGEITVDSRTTFLANGGDGPFPAQGS